MSLEIKATFLGLAAALVVLGLVFGLSPFLGPARAADSRPEPPTNATSVSTSPALPGDANRGHDLFERNCAHCHGDDARGDEGPNLYNLKISDARIARNIREGIKGEMPKFGAKLNDADIQALIAFLRTLKN